MTIESILTINPGSSTIKFGLFAASSAKPACLGKALLDLQMTPLELRVAFTAGEETSLPIASSRDELDEVVGECWRLLREAFPDTILRAVGHRVVHGGEHFDGPVEITARVLDEIKSLIPLAPLHQPRSIMLIEAIARADPSVLQTASFDTDFHRTLIPPARRLAIPRDLHDSGVRRYGFHGLSYSHIAQALRIIAPEIAGSRIVVAHLGSGASLCALKAGVSKDTTMGFSTLDGVPMSTRCGALDPGVILYLLRERGMTVSDVEALLYNRSGLLGMSGISGDTRVLLSSAAPEAVEALESFAFHIARSVAALVATLQGLGGIVFTGGVAEHQPYTRVAICERLGWLGVKLDRNANAKNATRITSTDSTVPVLVIPANEEQQIAADAIQVLMSIQKRGAETSRF